MPGQTMPGLLPLTKSRLGVDMRSKTYLFTLDLNPIVQPWDEYFDKLGCYSKLKRLAKLHNIVRRVVEPDKPENDIRVRVYGRLGKNSPYRRLYSRTRGNVRLRDASRFDVYIQGGWKWFRVNQK